MRDEKSRPEQISSLLDDYMQLAKVRDTTENKKLRLMLIDICGQILDAIQTIAMAIKENDNNDRD